MVSADTVYLLKRAQQLYGQTMGAFDITIYPLMQAWGFTDKEYRVPDAEEIEKLLEKTDAMQVMVDEENGRVEFGMDGMQIDLGGIAKGYTSARIMEIYKEAGIASGLVSLGGNVQALGTKPDGTLWRIGLQHPDKGGYLGILQVKDKAVITSGGYERYFEQDGVRYHHILDPATGYPARSGLISVTVVSADGALADGLSTSLFIMGKERAVQFWREHADAFDMVLYTEEGELYVTEGVSGDFSAEIPVNVIGREP
ncbi:MAG: FAD:protein FMN transferase, partial [Lachnospiraceae bacterium]|nr:FAD:protein FMN transferase [Lachnospiraceae bacterium]